LNRKSKEELIVKRSHRNRKKENDAVRVELKYCEHCGSLWLRPGGTELVYCESCQPKVAELPPPKKSPGRVQLPVAKRAVVERYSQQEQEFVEMDVDELDFEAVGGVA
jgi:Zn-finger nucleic acid-binding protein